MPGKHSADEPGHDLPAKQPLQEDFMAQSQGCNKPAKLVHMLICRNFIQPIAMLLLLCLGAQTVAFAAPSCQRHEITSRAAAVADCHTVAATTDDCCEQQCRQCSLLSATLSTAAVAAGPVQTHAPRLAHVANHFYQHIPLPHFRPPLLTL